MQIWGVLGLICIGLGWIPQILEIIRKKKSNLTLSFAILYSFGSLSLAIYSIQLKDWIFTILNLFAFLMAVIGLYYALRFKKIDKKNRK